MLMQDEREREREPSNKSAINGINFLPFKGTLPSFYGCAKMDLCLNRKQKADFLWISVKALKFLPQTKKWNIFLTDKCDHTRLFMFNACELNSNWHNIQCVVTFANALHMFIKKKNSLLNFPFTAHMVPIFFCIIMKLPHA